MAILAGAGGELIPEIDFSSFGNVADAAVWSQVHDEGVQILENVVNIRVPVIAAIEGRAHVHSEPRFSALPAKQDRCFFEINSSPDRLDLSAENSRLAAVAGVKIAVSTYAHSTREFELIRYGLDRRGGPSSAWISLSFSIVRLGKNLAS
jgi:hypothetical protein